MISIVRIPKITKIIAIATAANESQRTTFSIPSSSQFPSFPFNNNANEVKWSVLIFKKPID